MVSSISKLLKIHGISGDEYKKIKSILGREPSITELGIFSVMWSEHCSYKSSRIFLKDLPTSGERVIQGPGENAGIIDIGDGLAVVFKMESHNHPSFIEPFQGAATGVGGILRDIFTMGARPVALLDSLRFGPLNVPKNRYLLEGVVSGISSYGNCMGVPTVGGDVYFNDCYNNNILVNVMCAGIVRKDGIFRAKASGKGNPVIYVGSSTGRDGIHGATMASEGFGSGGEERRPTVQVGDPFTEKLLLEACLEAMGHGGIIAIQDMGAAGLTSSSVEMSARGGTGIEIDIDLVPRREEGMTPYEVMLSESQERMLIVCRKGVEKEIMDIFKKWGLNSCIIGRVTSTGNIVIRDKGKTVADIPVGPIAHPEPLKRPVKEPSYLGKLRRINLKIIKESLDIEGTLLDLIVSPTISSKDWIFNQYDYSVQTNTVAGPGADAAVLRIKGTEKAIAVTVDVNSVFCYLEPRRGASIAVAEAARNLSCAGAEPVGLTDCLNFGNPEDPGVMWQFRECVAGIAAACKALDIPVVSGNVSFYNETNGVPIYPTPTIGMVGLIEDASRSIHSWFAAENSLVGVIGPLSEDIGGSEYLRLICGKDTGAPPEIDLEMEKMVQRSCREANAAGLLESAHDCSDGGLAVALAECCFGMGIGARLKIEGYTRKDFMLFGEAPSRIIVSFREENLQKLLEVISKYSVPFSVFGKTEGDRLIIEGIIDIEVNKMLKVWKDSLRSMVERKYSIV